MTALVTGCAVLPVAAETLRFTVRHSIELERFMPVDVASARERKSEGDIGLRSPDRMHFVFQTRRGDLDDNSLIDTLWLVRSDDLARFLSDKGHGAAPAVSRLFMRRSPDEWGVNADLRWLNDREIGFVAADPRGVRQAFAFDIEARSERQLTFSESEVTAFAMQDDTILYYAAMVDEPMQVRRVDVRDIVELLDAEGYGRLFPRVTLFAQKRGGSPKAVAAPPMRLLPLFQSIWLSPNGKWAIALQPAIDWPPYWEEYEVPHPEIFGFRRSRATRDGTSVDLANRIQYRLIDIAGLSSKPLLDAPTGFLALNSIPAGASWKSDGKSVTVANTFLPLAAVEGAARRQRARQPVAAEIDIASGRITPVTNEPTRTAQKRTRDAYELSLRLVQSLNERPILHVIGGRCGCSKPLWDPNPDASRFSFGHAKRLEWRDVNGITWHGGLILPPAHDARQRYPLVIQTHGFDPGEFLVDGPQGTTSAFAAQPLANVGFAVLQVEDNATATTLDAQEAGRYAEGMRAAIATLAQQGVIDGKRVAAIGWSITGNYVVKLIDQHPDLLAAAVISDSAQFGYMSRLLSVNWPESSRVVFDRYASAPTSAEFVNRGPPIRLEAIGAASLVGMWETYALLRFAHRPVDFIYFPVGSHSLQKPVERLESQQGTVDWLRFWLLHQEDGDATRASQYSRWRQLRSITPTKE